LDEECDGMVKEDYCALKAASSETLSPLGFVRINCCAPEESAGVVKVRVFLSLKTNNLAAPRFAGRRVHGGNRIVA
jgi:hypothetical protein